MMENWNICSSLRQFGDGSIHGPLNGIITASMPPPTSCRLRTGLEQCSGSVSRYGGRLILNNIA
jgi:hypothetical protein